MAIVIFYHHSGFRCFKYYYQQIVQKAFKSCFPHSYSYSRFVNPMKQLNFPLFVLLTACRLATTSEGNYVDATKLVVSHNKCIPTTKPLLLSLKEARRLRSGSLVLSSMPSLTISGN